jgi:uncharacterized membrane protein
MTGTRLANPSRSERRLIAALCYLFTPVVPLVALRGLKSDDAFIERHARQGLLWAIPFLILLTLAVVAMVLVVSRDILFICLLPVGLALPLLPGAYWAKRVYFGGDVTFPGAAGRSSDD